MSDSRTRPGVPPAPPRRVRLPVNVQHWDRISFLHWAVDPAAVQALVPPGLRIDVYDGAAWVGVTPFRIRVRPLGVPVVLPGCSFPETNVRTYVIGPDGRRGIWFLRMEVTAAWFVVALRMLGLPYVRQRMVVQAAADAVHHRSRPIDRRSAGGHDIAIRPGRSLAPTTGGDLEQFLTARWHAYHRVRGLLLRTAVEHEPWHLQEAEITRCDVSPLFDAVGLRAPARLPLAHTSPGVVARLAAPVVVR